MKKFIFILFFLPKISFTDSTDFFFSSSDSSCCEHLSCNVVTTENWASAYNVTYVDNIDLNEKFLQKTHHHRTFCKKRTLNGRFSHYKNRNVIHKDVEKTNKIKIECEKCKNEYNIQKNKFLDNVKKYRFCGVSDLEYKKSFDNFVFSCNKYVRTCKNYDIAISDDYVADVMKTIFGGTNENILIGKDSQNDFYNGDFLIDYITNKFSETFYNDQEFMKKFFELRNSYIFSYVISMARFYKKKFWEFSFNTYVNQNGCRKLPVICNDIVKYITNFVSKLNSNDKRYKDEYIYAAFYSELLGRNWYMTSKPISYEYRVLLNKHNESHIQNSYNIFLNGIKNYTFDEAKKYIAELAEFYRVIFSETFLCSPSNDYYSYQNYFVKVFSYAAIHFRSFYDIINLCRPEWSTDEIVQIFFSELLKNDNKVFSSSIYNDFNYMIKYIMYDRDLSIKTNN